MRLSQGRMNGPPSTASIAPAALPVKPGFFVEEKPLRFEAGEDVQVE